MEEVVKVGRGSQAARDAVSGGDDALLQDYSLATPHPAATPRTPAPTTDRIMQAIIYSKKYIYLNFSVVFFKVVISESEFY